MSGLTKYAKTIIELGERDESVRDRLLATGELNEGYHPEMQAVHDANAAELTKIIDQIGYPTRSKVGPYANQAAWLVIQHAIAQPVFMRRCRDLLAVAVKTDEADPINLAYLTDRIAVFEGRPQLYGTQFDWDEVGQISPQACDDVIEVNARRAALGLNSVEEQIQKIRKCAITETQHPPADWEQRRQDYDRWRKAVGWLAK